MIVRKGLIGFGVILLCQLVASQAFALDNDIVLTRFGTFDPQEFAKDSTGTVVQPCTNACGTISSNKASFESLVGDLGQVMGPRIGAPAETLGEAGFAFNILTTLNFIPAEEEFWQEIGEYEEEKKVRYVTSVERIGFKRGVSEGRQKGMLEGRLEGLLEGTLEAIEMGLSVKFGVKGLRLLPEIRRIRDIERLNMIKQIIRVTDDLAEVEASLE